jgi:hypothetical protein
MSSKLWPSDLRSLLGVWEVCWLVGSNSPRNFENDGHFKMMLLSHIYFISYFYNCDECNLHL